MREMSNLINNPIAQMGFNQMTKKYILINLSFEIDKYKGLLSKIFTPEIRTYFDVNTELVRRKLMKIIVPFKTFEWE